MLCRKCENYGLVAFASESNFTVIETLAPWRPLHLATQWQREVKRWTREYVEHDSRAVGELEPHVRRPYFLPFPLSRANRCGF